MTRTSLMYVASAVLGVAAGIAMLAGVQAGRTGNNILLACDTGDPGCTPVTNPVDQIEVACDSSSGKGCDVQSDERAGLPCVLGVNCTQPDERIEVACVVDVDCVVGQSEGIQVVCDGPNCDGGYQSDANILIASANRGVEGGNG